jgi:hypothetical protein
VVHVPQLVEAAGVLVDEDHVAVTACGASALDLRVAAQRVADGVTLVRVVERHVHGRMSVRDDGVRDAVGHRLRAVRRPEVGVQLAGRRHVRDPGLAARVHRQLGDVGVPPVVRREDGARSVRQRLRCRPRGCDRDGERSQHGKSGESGSATVHLAGIGAGAPSPSVWLAWP